METPRRQNLRILGKPSSSLELQSEDLYVDGQVEGSIELPGTA
jgi:hypothetical protein